MTLLEAAAALRAKKVSSLELTRQSLQRSKELQPRLNAFLTFTADAATQSIYTWLYENGTHDAVSGNSGSQVNALQLRLIPEPSSAMLGLASLGMFFARRRR